MKAYLYTMLAMFAVALFGTLKATPGAAAKPLKPIALRMIAIFQASVIAWTLLLLTGCGGTGDAPGAPPTVFEATSTYAGGAVDTAYTTTAAVAPGPAIDVLAGDTVRVNLSGTHEQAVYFACARIVFVVTVSATGGVQLPAQRSLAPCMPGAVVIPIEGLALPGLEAGTHELEAHIVATAFDSNGQAVSALGPASGSVKWHVEVAP